MDFKAFKEKAIKFKNTTVKTATKLKNSTITSAAKKLAESGLVIKTKKDLDIFIDKSKNTRFTNKETWVTSKYTKHTIVIFVEKESEFYKDALVQVPVLAAKAWSSSVSLKMSDLDLKDLKEYNIVETPALALFTNKKLSKLVSWEENIKTIVKTLNLDIIKAIKNI